MPPYPAPVCADLIRRVFVRPAVSPSRRSSYSSRSPRSTGSAATADRPPARRTKRWRMRSRASKRRGPSGWIRCGPSGRRGSPGPRAPSHLNLTASAVSGLARTTGAPRRSLEYGTIRPVAPASYAAGRCIPPRVRHDASGRVAPCLTVPDARPRGRGACRTSQGFSTSLSVPSAQQGSAANGP